MCPLTPSRNYRDGSGRLLGPSGTSEEEYFLFVLLNKVDIQGVDESFFKGETDEINLGVAALKEKIFISYCGFRTMHY